MDKEIENALIPEVRIIQVGIRNYDLKKLTIKQILKLGKFLTGFLKANKDKLDEIVKRFGDGSRTQIEDISVVLDILDEKQITELFGILLNDDDLVYLEKNLDLESALDIFKQVMELNSNTNVKKNFNLIMDLISGKVKPNDTVN